MSLEIRVLLCHILLTVDIVVEQILIELEVMNQLIVIKQLEGEAIE